MGLRQGEALGLTWDDIDLGMGYVRIGKQLQREMARRNWSSPTWSVAGRTIAMPPMIAAALRDHRDRQRQERERAGERWKESGLVFTTPIGTPLDGTAVTKEFHRLLGRAGLPQRRFHDLRHSCATLLLVQGVSPRVVMDILGHSQISLTMNTYSRVIPDLRHDAAQRMQEVLKDQRER